MTTPGAGPPAQEAVNGMDIACPAHMPSTLTRFLGRLSVGRKLLLIFLLDMSAVIYISGILVNEKYLAINFARKELAGNAYIAGLQDAMLASAAGQTPPGAQAQVKQAEQLWGEGMSSAEPSEAFVAALQALQAAPAPGAAQQALDRGRELVTRVGNQSNLILDPDLDSYYTMSLIVLRMPELLDAISGVSAHVLARPVGSGDAGAQARHLLLEGRLDTGWQATSSDYAEAFAASTPALRTALTGSRQTLQVTLEQYRESARAAMAGGAGPAERQALMQAHHAVLTGIGQAWQQARGQMDRLLHARIEAAFHRMWLHLGTALALLALILTAVFFVARQIAMPLKRLATVADQVRLTGDHSLRASWHASDEIGRLVLGFNDMLAQLDRERVVQQELAASARAAQAQQQLVEAMPIPMMVTAVPGHQVLHANRPAQAWLGNRVDDPWRAGLDPAVRSRFFQQLADRDAVDEFEVRWNTGAEPSWAVLSARRLEFQGQSAVLTAFTPINHLKFMERRLELWAKVFEASGEGIVIIDAQHRILTANLAFCRSTGYELHELIGESVAAADELGGSAAFLAGLWPQLERRSQWQGEVEMQRRNGSRYPAWLMLNAMRDGKQGAVSHYIATTIDISDRKRNEERIRFLAQHDVLTELPNRSLCVERLRLALQHAQRRGDKVAVLFIDLDRFKHINDSLGHHIGDGLLRSVARRLLDSVRIGDTVSRLGGDEFVVVLDGVSDLHEVVHIVDQRLVPRVREPHEVGGTRLHISCSVGVALYPDDALDLDTLMRHADVAMYQAKALGRDTAHFFTADLNERAQARARLESNLHQALEREELSLHYQPRVDAHSHRVLGVEALLRWSSPALGQVAPAQFIPIAEETRLIVPIGAWVIDEACRQMADWRGQGLAPDQVSINVSALQLGDDSLVETLRAALERHGLPAGTVELELTESMLMDRAEQTLDRLHAIKRLGVELAIDDFGTGYSSLNYLNRFPIDRLKVDRSFVRDMFEDPADLAITRAIIGLGHTLGLRVVAEGVETEREAQTLRAAGCDELQGYLIARPLAAGDLQRWLQQRNVGAPALEAAAQ
jgi:diguanylate cyclase (GGDEF)-like protein/PAS domain S-box-containing protein